jgi:hypothetical protein
MKVNGSGKAFLVSRAVEEPIEATFELGEEINRTSKTLIKPIFIWLIGCIFFLVILAPSVYNTIIFLIESYRGNIDVSTIGLIRFSILALILIILIAITITTLVYFIQINSFTSHLIQRYSFVSELKTARLTEKKNTEEMEKGLKKGIPRDEEIKKYVNNPIFATIDLVEESLHELPQLIRLFNICKYFILINLIYIILSLIIKLIFNQNLLFSIGYWEYIFGIITIIIQLAAIMLISKSVNIIHYIQARHDIIDSIRFEKDINIPPDKTHQERIISYLDSNDPFIKVVKIPDRDKIQNITIQGYSKKDYTFDVYFTINNELPAMSKRLGLPKSRFSVFVKIFKKPISIKALKDYKNAVMDVCEVENTFPIRIIALQWIVSELAEDVYEYVLDEPIIVKDSMAHIQIVGEDGDIYSFIPLVSYGKEM